MTKAPVEVAMSRAIDAAADAAMSIKPGRRGPRRLPMPLSLVLGRTTRKVAPFLAIWRLPTADAPGATLVL